MKIIEIMKESALLLGLKDERSYMEMYGQGDTTCEYVPAQENVSSLFNLVKYAIRELCTNYIPMIDALNIVTTNNKFALAELPNYIRIQNVCKNGEPVKFKIINRNVILEEDGEYEVTYATYPEIETYDDEIDFLDNFSPDVLVMGLCSYYALAHGMFEEFEKMHEQYVEKAESLKHLKIFEMPSRRWQWEIKKLLR